MIRAFVLTLIATLTTFGPAGSGVDLTTQVTHYETTCEKQVRTSRGIPPMSIYLDRGLIAWQKSHMIGNTPDAELAEYAAADAACSPATFDFDNMVIVNIEHA